MKHPMRGTYKMKGAYKTAEVSTPDLAKLAIEAHGVLERWKRFSTVSIHGINGGVPWATAKPESLVTSGSQLTFATRRLLTGPSAVGIESLAANLNASRSRTRTVR
jgi:hypothetical protein